MLFRIKIHLSIIFLSLFLIYSCNKDQKVEAPLQMHRDYVRLDSGMILTYEVDSYFYDNFDNTIDTYEYIVQEKILHQIDSTSYKIKAIKKDSLDDPNGIPKIYSVKKTKDDYQSFRENIRTVKLTFPVKDGITWDGNVYNDRESQSFRYDDVHQSFSEYGLNFPKTTTVIEKDQGNLIEKSYRQVVYAKQIGKIYVEEMALRFEGDSIPPEDIPWEEKANTGYIIRHKLKKYKLP